MIELQVQSTASGTSAHTRAATPMTVIDILSSVLPLQGTGLAEISRTQVGREFQKKIMP